MKMKSVSKQQNQTIVQGEGNYVFKFLMKEFKDVLFSSFVNIYLLVKNILFTLDIHYL